ncbi:hypothetical protein SNEBB_008474 [Seison nebaliae]|nr:hypothetical protein SNEBB_008474 [Seison nebaliae]
MDESNTAPKMKKLDDVNAEKILEDVLKIQRNIDKLNEEASLEILDVERRFNLKKKPFYEDRSSFIKKISNFWSTALINHPRFADLLTSKDLKVLNYLSTIEVTDMVNTKSGYRIEFFFEENPYFSNTSLYKEFTIDEIGLFDSKPSGIVWKEENEVTQSEDDSGKKRKFTEEICFMDWFADRGDEHDGFDDDLSDLGEIIRDEIWPNPISLYMQGEEKTDDDEPDEEEEDFDEDDDEMDEENDNASDDQDNDTE